jgi:6-phosphogluconolactonase
VEIVIRDDAVSAANAAAMVVVELLREAIAARGRATLAVSGGTTPLPMFSALASANLEWGSIEIFQVDERIAPAGDAARNAAALLAHLIEPARIPAENVHLMPVERDDLSAAAAEYAALLERLAGRPPRIDVIHLGLGNDGHTASLVPGDAALTQTSALVAITGEYQGYRRITLTFPVLDRGGCLVWLISGADKARALDQLRHADDTIPAGRVRAQAAVVFADAAASGA